MNYFNKSSIEMNQKELINDKSDKNSRIRKRKMNLTDINPLELKNKR